MKKDNSAIDFWPGYVDAMVNILLNLLFLAGIFTTGLVMFNAQSVLNRMQEVLIKSKKESVTPIDTKEVIVIDKKPKILEAKKMQTKNIEPEVSQTLVKEFRFSKKRAENSSTIDLNLFEKFVSSRVGANILTSFEFMPEQLYWTKDLVVSDEVLNGLQNGSMLVVLTKPEDARLSLEAYTRMISLRTLLIRKYHLEKTPQIRIVSHGSIGNEKLLERYVFLVNSPSDKQ